MSVTVSIILPTYNRARFLPQAFASIKSQQFTDWELIVVDDGSTDGSKEIIEREFAEIEQPTRYIYQENQGAYGARNTGLNHATGKYIAFFDSDDEWLPHHLRDCVEALNANPDVDWVYGACRMVDDATGEVLSENTFYVDGKPRAFLKLNTCESGLLRIIEDRKALKVLCLDGFFCGLQNSVVRRNIFDKFKFSADFRNEAEDVLFAVRVLDSGFRFGYFETVHVTYHVHSSNSTNPANDIDRRKTLDLNNAFIEGIRALLESRDLQSNDTRRFLRQSLASLCFWRVGYSILWMNGQREEALKMFLNAIRLHKTHLPYWKTFLLCLVKYRLS